MLLEVCSRFGEVLYNGDRAIVVRPILFRILPHAISCLPLPGAVLAASREL